MDALFWQQRWENNEIAFHQPSANPHLQRFWPQLQAKQSVFVPLAGKSTDMLWLSDQGHQILAVELSEIAVAAFFAEHNLQATIDKQEPFKRWRNAQIEFLCGDFFALEHKHLSHITCVYDRAALIALPAAMRKNYVNHLQKILPNRSEILLITFDYPQHEMSGPPFSVSEQEVHRLYGQHYAISRHLRHDAWPDAKRFQAKGLTALWENVYQLSPKKSK